MTEVSVETKLFFKLKSVVVFLKFFNNNNNNNNNNYNNNNNGNGYHNDNNKQLLDEVEHDIMNYQNRGLCYLPKPKAEADNTDTRF